MPLRSYLGHIHTPIYFLLSVDKFNNLTYIPKTVCEP